MFQCGIKNPLKTTLQYVSWCGVYSSLQCDFMPTYRKILVVLIVIVPVYFVIDIICQTYKDFKDIAAFLLITGYLLEWVNFLVIQISSLYTARSLTKFFYAVEQAQRSLSSLNIAQPDVPSQFHQIIYIAFGVVLPILVSVIAYTTTVMSVSTFYIIFSHTLLVVTSCATLIKIKMMLTLVTAKFEVLNCYLKQLSKKIQKHKSEHAHNCNTCSKFTCEHCFVDKPNEPSLIISIDKIFLLNAAHFQLCDAYIALNELFSLSGFIMCLTISFNFLKPFILNRFLLFYIMIVSNSIVLILIFISMLTYATNATVHSQETGYLIFELMTEEHPKHIEEELQLFSYMPFHRKIEISAAGYFTIDLMYLTKIFCTLIPLTLIMIQRDKHV